MNHEIRQQYKVIRQAIPIKEKIQAHQKIAKNFQLYTGDSTKELHIASYKATTDEASPIHIDEQLMAGNLFYYPVLHPFLKRGLWFAKDQGEWHTNQYQLQEPKIDIRHFLAPWELDIVLVPLVAFDQNKHRIGMGGGFYDYSFAFKRHVKENTPILIGIAFDEQQVNSIKKDTWGVELDVIITPTQIII